jgi:hypothetical protein
MEMVSPQNLKTEAKKEHYLMLHWEHVVTFKLKLVDLIYQGLNLQQYFLLLSKGPLAVWAVS